MASITIRNLDDEVKTRLRVRAASNGRSMEEEARNILREATEEEAGPRNLAQAVRERFAPYGGVELEIPPREPTRDPPTLVGVVVLFWLFFGGVGAQDAGAQDVYNPPRDYTVREIADRTFPPACAGRGCGRQRFSVTITTTESDSARMEWAMKDAVFYDIPDRAHAVLVYLVDKWPGGTRMAIGDYSADGCGWAGSRDGKGCGGPKWEMQWLHRARDADMDDEPGSGVVVTQGAAVGQRRELVGRALDSWLKMTCTPEHAGLVAREKDKDDLFEQLMFSGRRMLSSQAEAEVARRLGPKLFDVGGGAVVGVPSDSLLKLGFRDLSVPREERVDTAPIGPDGFPYSRFLMTLYLDALGENLSEKNIIGFAVIRACYFQREPRVFIVDEYGEPRWWVDNYLKVRSWR